MYLYGLKTIIRVDYLSMLEAIIWHPFTSSISLLLDAFFDNIVLMVIGEPLSFQLI